MCAGVADGGKSRLEVDNKKVWENACKHLSLNH